MKCPVCAKKGLKSRVYPRGSESTCMGYFPYYDEEGVHHCHDGNSVTSYYSCSEGHEWRETSYHSCPCGWSGGESSTRIIKED
jgi:hypothetical protein